MSETKTSSEERNHEFPAETRPASAGPEPDAIRRNHRTFHENLARRFRAELAQPSGGTMAQVDALLHDAYRERASDIHLDAESNGLRVRFRVDGVVLDTCLLGRGAGRRLTNQFKGMARIDPVTMFVPEEARFTYVVDGREVGFRVEVAPCLPGDKLTVRILEPNRVQQRLGHLGLSEEGLIDIRDWLGNVNGMFLVAGPTGSGKTTTLYALLHEFK
ncbi:MAG: ATPase, T2SS/T4P/T4SS family, partial [Planctomycetota bacterium]